MSDHRSDDEVFWVEPRERAIIPLDGLILSKSLRKTIRQDRFHVTCDADFDAVIDACAAPRDEDSESWISYRIEASYRALHRAGHAHSVECWRDGELVGGLYGVAFDRVFCGESMFSRANDASKVALSWLVAAMRHAGYQLLDCQFMTGHLASLGAVAIPQADYVSALSSVGGVGAEGDGVALGDGRGAGARPLAPLPELFSLAAASASPGKLILQSLTQTS